MVTCFMMHPVNKKGRALPLNLHFDDRSMRLKGMSDERQNRPILSADKIARQKSVVCHAKIARFCRPR